MKKQYCIVKYVMAENANQALNKSKKVPISEIYIHNAWLEKNTDHNMFGEKKKKYGFVDKK
jgi:hypothetical protein